MVRAFTNLSLRYKMLIPVFVLVLATGTIIWTADAGINDLRQTAAEIIATSAERQALSLRVIGEINEASLISKNIMLETGEPELKVYEKRYQAKFAEALGTTDKLIALPGGQASRGAEEALRATILHFREATDKSVQLKMANDVAGAMHWFEAKAHRRAARS